MMQFSQAAGHADAARQPTHPADEEPYPNRRKIVKESFHAGRVLAENRFF